MSIKIHHGPPGSYKTAGAMGDDFLREARAGRVIVTNVRGVTRARVLDEFPDLPETFDVIQVEDKTNEGREKWAKWFHWVPKGAFLFIDEIQDIWPKSWRQTDLDLLDYPGGIEQAGKDDRPHNWAQAFDKHRHWNWDMVLTTPSYKKVRDDIKGTAEMAYKHKNLAIIGIRGRYIEGAHLADDDGGSASQFLTVNQKKVPKYVFKLYDSTATGTVTDTKAGFNLLKNPRVAIVLCIFFGVLVFVGIRPAPKMFGGSAPAANGQAPKAGPQAPLAGGASPAALAGGAAPAGQFSEDVRLEPFIDGNPHIVISVRTKDTWKYAVKHLNQEFTNNDLLDMGYTLHSRGHCGLIIKRDGFSRFITCAGDEMQQQKGPGVPQQPFQVASAPDSITVNPAALAPPRF